ncbi:MAG: tautomerase family protein [Bacteroidetes bacterium]|nr:MAG: tautomerase family protein [Bacteroidota bacterium]
MPLVTITLPEGKSPQFIQSLSTIVHEAMVETINCPPDALYHIINQVKREQLTYMPEYKGMKRSENVIILQITLKEGRTPEQKKQMYEKISSGLNSNLGIRFEDIIIILTDSAAENWYFGRNG